MLYRMHQSACTSSVVRVQCVQCMCSVCAVHVRLRLGAAQVKQAQRRRGARGARERRGACRADRVVSECEQLKRGDRQRTRERGGTCVGHAVIVQPQHAQRAAAECRRERRRALVAKHIGVKIELRERLIGVMTSGLVRLATLACVRAYETH